MILLLLPIISVTAQTEQEPTAYHLPTLVAIAESQEGQFLSAEPVNKQIVGTVVFSGLPDRSVTLRETDDPDFYTFIVGDISAFIRAESVQDTEAAADSAAIPESITTEALSVFVFLPTDQDYTVNVTGVTTGTVTYSNGDFVVSDTAGLSSRLITASSTVTPVLILWGTTPPSEAMLNSLAARAVDGTTAQGQYGDYEVTIVGNQ